MPDNFFNNIYTIHNGINFDSTYQVKKRTGSEFQLAIIGTLNSNKNQLEALKFICRSPYNIKLKILGDGPMLQELVNYTYIHNIKDRVEFFGFVLDPVKELQNCHALLILSKNEAFPFVALEAMSVGVPVIATDVGGLPELIQDGVDGFLLPRSEFSNLDSIVKALEANEELRFVIGENALMKVRNSFTVEHMTNKFLMAVGHD
jgi:glycosyltransferase involved in cell wall biosynthesis